MMLRAITIYGLPPISTGIALALLSMPSAAMGKALSNSLNARVRVDTSCRMTVEPMRFGDVNFLSGEVNATALIHLRCGPNVAYSVALDNGRNFNGQRRMRSAAFSVYVPYQIYRDAGHRQVWGATPATMVTGTTPANGDVTLRAYGQVPNSLVLPLAYTDVVTVTVNF